jgi:hypothetical protein
MVGLITISYYFKDIRKSLTPTIKQSQLTKEEVLGGAGVEKDSLPQRTNYFELQLPATLFIFLVPTTYHVSRLVVAAIVKTA